MRGVGRMKSPYTDSLAHTTWECKYHIVFAPKFRRKEIYGKLKQEIGMILRELCRRKEVEIKNVQFFKFINAQNCTFLNLIFSFIFFLFCYI